MRSSNKSTEKDYHKDSWRIWREPLIHFFVLGLVVFGLHTFLERSGEEQPEDPFLVEVSSADIEWMRTIFAKQMGREPTARDLRGQLHQLIREQVLSREAAAMGLDENDTVVRRRLAQKMEFLFKDLSAVEEPTREELQAYFSENRKKYELPPEITFSQVYFNSDRRGADAAREAAAAFSLRGVDPASAATSGDPSILAAGCERCRPVEIGSRFGKEFAAAILELTPGRWHGPVRSSYGFHAVHISERREARMPGFEEVSQRLKNDWQFSRQEENSRKVYDEIRSRYRVMLEGLPYDGG